MQYIGLLRGINVGGKNKLPMAELRNALDVSGFGPTRSYIASGNIIFHHPETKIPIIQRDFEALVEREFGIRTRILVLDAPAFLAINSAIPDDWANDETQKSDVLFLFPEYDAPETMETLGPIQGIDTAHYVPGALLWNVTRKLQTRSALQKVVGTALYKAMTVRNVNTVRKLAGMLGD